MEELILIFGWAYCFTISSKVRVKRSPLMWINVDYLLSDVMKPHYSALRQPIAV